ncbi:ankyrin [Plectosphaerella plurivora]|uniref:Ankyrin n=1 Tax=Plectosphaerella plurivora TaxID=936078 RepID=A0A9P8V9S5_9PEZI|nr:ankyrin [Plectosphaerella plurivora]
MADPLSLAASITGVLAFAAATARSLVTLVQEVRDAPEDVIATGRDVRSLAAILASAHDTCARHDLDVEEKDLAAALAEYVDMCQEAMQGLRIILRPLAAGGSSVRFVLGWTMRRGDVKALRGRLNEGKASLNLALSALHGVLEGKGQEDIRADIGKVYGQMMNEFRNLESGKKIRKRLEDDVASVTSNRTKGRRPSVSNVTDSTFVMRRFLQPANGESGQQNTTAVPTTSMSPWASDSNAILDAVRSGNRALIANFVESGVSLSARSAQGYTALHFCAISDDAETCAILLDHGADVNGKDFELRSPFRLALASEALAVARVLAERGCVIGDLSAALIKLAVRTDEVPGTHALLRTIAERLNNTKQGPYLVHEVIDLDDAAALAMLLDDGFSVTKPDRNGFTPYHYALRHEKKAMMKVLFNHGADVNERVPRTVLESVNIPSDWHLQALGDGVPDFTPLGLAARYMRNGNLTKFLLDNGADPNQPTGADRAGTILVGMCAHEFFSEAKLLIQAGANTNHLPPDGRGPMYWAAICNNNNLMAFMLQHGADITYQRPGDGVTPLMIAASQGNSAIAETLLKAGADPSVRNKEGKTALDRARAAGHSNLVAILEGAMSQR